MEKIKTDSWTDIYIKENENYYILTSEVNWADFTKTFHKNNHPEEKERYIRQFESLLPEANKIFRKEQTKYIWKIIKEIFLSKPMILLERDSNNNRDNEILIFSSWDPNNHGNSHYYFCDFYPLKDVKNQLEGQFLKEIWVKRIKDWFLLCFYIIEDYRKLNINKEIKVFIPAYSDLGSYYSDDVTLQIYQQKNLILESIAKNNGSSYSFNKNLEE